MAEPAKKFDALEAELTDLAIELYECFEPRASQPDSPATLHHWLDRMERLGTVANDSGLPGLSQLCSKYRESLTSLARTEHPLTASEKEQLEQWPLLSMAYIAAPQNEYNTEALLRLLQNTTAESPWIPDEINALRTACISEAQTPPSLHNYISDHEVDVIPHDANIAFDAHLLDSLQQEVLDTISVLFNELDTPFANEEETVETTVEALRLCADRVKLLGMSAATSGLFGLMDVCQLFQDCLFQLAEQHRTIHSNERDTIEHWRSLVVAYLDSPSDTVTIDALVDFYNHVPWLPEILEEDTLLLKDMLMPEQIQLEDQDAPRDPSVPDHAAPVTHDSHAAVGPNDLHDDAIPAQEPGTTEHYSEPLLDAPEASQNVQEPEMPATTAIFIDDDRIDDDKIENNSAPGGDSPLTSSYWLLAGDASQADETTQTNAPLPAAESSRVMPEVSETLIISEQQQELIQLVQSEILANESSLAQRMATINSNSDTGERLTELRQYHDNIERISIAAESVGLLGLHKVFSQLLLNARFYQNDLAAFSPQVAELFGQWPAMVVAYLDDIQDSARGAQVSRYLLNALWPHTLTQQSADELAYELAHPEFPLLDDDTEVRPTVAQAEDVSLALPEDVNKQLLDSLLQELPGHTAEFTQAVTNIVENKANLHDVEVAKRIAHTLKGSANTVGVAGIANLAHHIEDILIAFTKHQTLPGAALADMLMNSADVLEMMSEALIGIGPVPEQARSVLQSVLDWANRIDAEGIPEIDSSTDSNTDSITDFNADPGTEPNNKPPLEADTSQTTPADSVPVAQDTTPTAMLRIPASLVDELLRLVGESIILTGQLHEHLAQAQVQTQAVSEQNALFQQLTFELEQLVDVQGVASALEQGSLQTQFDSLELDQYNELHTVTRRLVEAATDAREITEGVEDHLSVIDDLLVDQGRLQKQNQVAVMQTRMVPVKTIIPRLQRSVRQTCRLTEKKVELAFDGGETLIDSDVLNELVDPLMHVLRNAVDHGIELPARREAKAKPPTGHIQLSFSREGDHIVVRCRDDGAGLDYADIKSIAVEKNLIAADKEVSEAELARLVLVSGFSTRRETTQVSGRGIGLDAVYSGILRLKGSLSIESQPDQGCTMEFRLPVTLISVHSLLVTSGNHRVAVSTRGVEQIMYIDAGVLNQYDGQTTFTLGEELLSVDYLEALLHWPVDQSPQHHPNQPVLIVRDETGDKRAIIVEQVRASLDLVVKPLGLYAPHIEGVEGATILGDGSVATVIDLPSLLRGRSQDMASDSLVRHARPDHSAKHVIRALVVDDSLSARRSLAELLHDFGYDALTARDGMDAIDVMATQKLDILLVDLEMPRMNGLELTSHIRATADAAHLPIIMITSRSTEKHRQQALRLGVDAYFTKPYVEDDLIRQIESQLDRAMNSQTVAGSQTSVDGAINQDATISIANKH